MAKAKAVKKQEPAGGFNVESDGLVDIRLELKFERAVAIRVSPAVAERIMSGEFDGRDVGDVPEINPVEVLNDALVEVSGAYEGHPPK